MIGRPAYEALYENLVVQPSLAYREAIGPPVDLDPEAFELFLAKLKDFRGSYPNMAFWQIVDYKSLKVLYSDGDLPLFGRKFTSFKDFFRQMHPDYVHPYLRWRTAAFHLVYSQQVIVDPLDISYRFGLPLQTQEDQYYWFTMNSTIVQVDAQQRIVTTLQTFYRETKWSPRNLRPVEAGLTLRSGDIQELEGKIITQLSLQLIDEFTDAELELLLGYAAGKSPAAIMAQRGWSKHTLHEYNANILRKARALFVYDFRSARNFAEFCEEKGYIHFQRPPT